jgi:hypothetical protein
MSATTTKKPAAQVDMAKKAMAAKTDASAAKPRPNPQAYEPSDLIWGAAGIGQVLGLTERQMFHLLEEKKLKSPKKVAGRYCASRAKLLEECGGA